MCLLLVHRCIEKRATHSRPQPRLSNSSSPHLTCVLFPIRPHAACPRRMFSGLSQKTSGRTSSTTATACHFNAPKRWQFGGSWPVRGHSGLRKPIRLASQASTASWASRRRRRAAQPFLSASVMCATSGRIAQCVARVLLYRPLLPPPPHLPGRQFLFDSQPVPQRFPRCVETTRPHIPPPLLRDVRRVDGHSTVQAPAAVATTVQQ